MIIKLTRGFETVIDDIDADLAKYNWCYHLGYAIRNWQISDRLPRRVTRLHKTILERSLSRTIADRMECDHIDRNKLNNRRDNLRETTSAINSLNKSLQINNTSGYRGVVKLGDRWRAQIRINGMQTILGTFDLKEEASKVFLDKYYKTHRKYPPEVEENILHLELNA